MFSGLHSLLLLFLICGTDASTPSASAVSTGSTSLNATCPSRTINYITHGLPQQCLTSSWRAATISVSAITTDDVASLSVTEHTSSKATVYHIATTETPIAPDSAEEPKPLPPSVAQSVDESASTSSPGPESSRDEIEEASPLDDSKFLSYEEWKKQNLQNAGQSEHLGREERLEKIGSRKRPTNIHTALDSLGDDAEIDLDFTGFIPDAPDLATPPKPPMGGELAKEALAVAPSAARARSMDAGTTCKERFNYASFDCAANILKHNPEATSSGAVLGENKDSYMLNQCSANNKFLILELCDDIWIDTIVLANFEFFSSIFRTFRVSISDRYPVKIDKWKTVGIFEARHSRDVQAFLVENPSIWARYVRIEFLTHYGNEYYCPVSLVRVHGTTMLEEYKRDLNSAQGEEDSVEDEADAAENAAEGNLVYEGIADVVPSAESRLAVPDTVDHHAMNESKNESKEEFQDDTDQCIISSSLNQSVEAPMANQDNFSPNTAAKLFGHANNTCACDVSVQPESMTLHKNAKRGPSENEIATKRDSTINKTVSVTAMEHLNESSHEAVSSNSSTTLPEDGGKASGTIIAAATTNGTTTVKSKPSQTSASTQASPTMQESFFKSVQKRLQMLETNSSLSLQYIEDQSRALRDAFGKVEQRQLAKTTTFLDYLNRTVLSELRDFRQQYDQLWQSTVFELDSQRERYQQETTAMNTRLGILADEVIYQKRISIIQMILILVCLALIIFSRGNQYLEIPRVQSVLSRSPSAMWLNRGNLETPTQSPPATRPSSVHKPNGILKSHRRMQSEDSVGSSSSAQELYSPPTPVSLGAGSDNQIEAEVEGKSEDPPDFDPSTIERPSTSPPILPSSSPPQTPHINNVSGLDSINSKLFNSSPEHFVDADVPRLIVEEATPPPKHLKWNLPDF